MTREEALNNLDDLLQYGGLVMSEKYIESIRIAVIELEKTLKKELCEDAISRHWLMECVNEGWIKFDTEKDRNIFIHFVRDIASLVTIQIKTGYWIAADGDNAICSCCNRLNRLYGAYCKHCGARMQEVEDGNK